MFHVCSVCGKVHPYNQKCHRPRKYDSTEERKLRSSIEWKNKSIEVRDKAHYLCEVCRDQGILNYNGIEVHHITKLSEDSNLLLDNDNLIALCQFHHREADKGNLDADYLRELAKHREAK